MAQAFICRLVATEAGLDPRPVHCGICFGQSGAGTGFSTSTFFFFTCYCHSVNTTCLFIHSSPLVIDKVVK